MNPVTIQFEISAAFSDPSNRSTLHGGPLLTLTGPGIDGSETIAPVGLPEGFVAARADNRALFPRGVDVVLVSGRDLLALPRTTVVAVADGSSSNAEAN